LLVIKNLMKPNAKNAKRYPLNTRTQRCRADQVLAADLMFIEGRAVNQSLSNLRVGISWEGIKLGAMWP